AERQRARDAAQTAPSQPTVAPDSAAGQDGTPSAADMAAHRAAAAEARRRAREAQQKKDAEDQAGKPPS
ncbi:MAG TPA: hypothetical protein VF459_14090, partial [Caulobacteraceae bacterium]